MEAEVEAEAPQSPHRQAEVIPEEAELHITLKEGVPYDLWNLKGLARPVRSSQHPMAIGRRFRWRCKETFRFVASRYPGYAHRRTLGGPTQPGQTPFLGEAGEVPCRTHVFVREWIEEKET